MKFLKKYRYTIISLLFVVLYGVLLSTFESINRTVFDILYVLLGLIIIYFTYKSYITSCKYVSLKLKVYGLLQYIYLVALMLNMYDINFNYWERKVSVKVIVLLFAISFVFGILAYGEKYKLEKENEV